MRTKAAVLIVMTGCLGMVAAQEFPEFKAWMKRQDAAMQALKKMENRTGPQAMSSAERIGAACEQMIGFFRQRGGKDAVKWSEEGKAAAARLATAAYAGNAAEADAAFKEIGATCNGCHKVYRTKLPDGRYTFTSEEQREAAKKAAGK